MIQNMERTSDWMWTRRKFNSSSHLQTSSYNDSWEEQAFAEDSAGPLGGCIWPPRSYSCSFCRREFRSAQALGGHMNVHRRDRARLRQSPSSSHNDNQHLLQRNPHQNPCTLLDQYPSEVRALVYPNPNFPSPLSSSRVSVPSTTQENSSDKTLVSPQPPPIAFQVLSISRNSLRAQEIDCLGKGDSSKLESAVSSSNLVSRKRQIEASKDEEALSFKRMRNNVSFPFFIRPTAPIEDLDLELRLGDRPKVK